MIDGKKKKKLEANFYGLTGAGLQMRDSPIKILCRHPEINSLCSKNQ
jgi:hypothetical protein